MRGRVRIELLTGIIFITAMFVLAYYTILVSQREINSENAYEVTVRFIDAAGLKESHRVTVNGVDSGAVKSVTLKNNFAEVKLAMFNHFELYSNYRIFITSESAIGGKQIRIYPGSESDDSGHVFEQIHIDQPLIGTLRDPIETINVILNENRDNIRVAVANLRVFSEKLNSNKGTLSKLLSDDTIAEQTSTLLEQLKDTVEDAREQAPVTSFIRAALMAF